MSMYFNDLSLAGWSYEKGDLQIALRDHITDKRILSRNPVEHTFVYEDEDEWRERLQYHSKKVADMGNMKDEDINAFLGVHNGAHKHIEGACPEVMAAFPKSNGFQMDFTLGCASIIVGAQLAGLHFSRENINNIVMGSVQMTTQWTENYNDGNAVFADGIGALAFKKSDQGHQIKYTSVASNSEFRDMFVLDNNGIYQLANLQKGRELTEFMISSFSNQLRESCITLKTIPKNIDYIAISCSTYAATKRVLDAINFPLEKTGIECLTKVPHMGTNDLIFQLEYGLEKGLIEQGSKILMTGTSAGFSIATMALEW